MKNNDSLLGQLEEKIYDHITGTVGPEYDLELTNGEPLDIPSSRSRDEYILVMNEVLDEV